MDSSEIFYSFSPFIREFIYANSWESLHEMQLEAARVIFTSEDNLLLSSSTASGKTEAAFFPILSELYEAPAKSFGVLYVAPLKSLINDQFDRISALCDSTGINVFHWHGDVAASHKSKALRNPSGILQITPESLESMLIRRPADAARLFSDLRYVVLDEIHTLVGTDRGGQILCQLSRLSALTGNYPRRVGLSATLGDLNTAAAWLSAGSERNTAVPEPKRLPLKMRLGLEHFFINNDTEPSISEDVRNLTCEGKDAEIIGESCLTAPTYDTYHMDAGFEYVYDCVKDKKALVFSNSREETEYVTATLRQIAERRNEDDIFLIHHGNLSASIREEAEAKMKSDYERAVTCATVTLELGVDIGQLERVVQIGAPNSVSSFLQRLGRSGRRGDSPEMMMVFREEIPLPNAPLPQLIPWELLRGIAVAQLYIEERFIEPPWETRYPFSLLFQQTLSVLASSGAMTPKRLWDKISTLPPFKNISKEDYKTLLYSMLNEDFLEMTEEGELLVGLRGERLTDSFKFFAVFKDSEDYTVRWESDEIGTITASPPPGDRFALAGRVWEVEECDIPRRLVYVHPVKGKMETSWPGEYGEIHTKILKRMKLVLQEDTVYPYLKEDAKKRLESARKVARRTGMTKYDVLSLGGMSYVLFPWLGTRAFRTARRFLAKHGAEFSLTNLEFEGCYYMTFRLENGKIDALMEKLSRIAAAGIDADGLVSPSESPAFGKYDPYIPSALLRKAYVADKLAPEEAGEYFSGGFAEFLNGDTKSPKAPLSP